MNNPRYDSDLLSALVRSHDDLLRSWNPRAAQPRENVSSHVWSPAVDVFEDQDAIVIKADLPGMKQEDIDIELNKDTLTIKGERKFEDTSRQDKYVRVERQYGAFQRSFTVGIPIEPEKVSASYRNGILELTIPKAEAIKPKKVQVTAE